MLKVPIVATIISLKHSCRRNTISLNYMIYIAICMSNHYQYSHQKMINLSFNHVRNNFISHRYIYHLLKYNVLKINILFILPSNSLFNQRNMHNWIIKTEIFSIISQIRTILHIIPHSITVFIQLKYSPNYQTHSPLIVEE